MAKPVAHDAQALAIDGGTPLCPAPLPAWPDYPEDEVEAAAAVLRSGKVNYWTGEQCRAFEREFADYCGVAHAVAVANGTLALELALLALGVGEGDEVIVTPRTFIASASAAIMRGATPVFADIDPRSQNITAQSIAAVITPRTRAIIAVHLAGWPCDMDPIMALAAQHDLFVIEDCAQAHGARYKERPVGSLGHVAAFSFCQDKIMSTGGEGGMLVTDDEALWSRAWSFKDHGKSYDAVYRREHPPGFRWLHESFGSNWRLTEMQAAIGRLQLRKLDDWVARRRANAARLDRCCEQIPALQVVVPPNEILSACYKYYVFVDAQKLAAGWDRDRIMAAISAEGVPCFSGSCSEIYREQAFAGTASVPQQALPNAARLAQTSLMLLVHPTQGDVQMDQACAAISKVMAVAQRVD